MTNWHRLANTDRKRLDATGRGCLLTCSFERIALPMMEAITNALMLLMQPCYALTQNWWLAIALFTVLVKVILLPLSLWCQKNSIVMVQLMPELNRIKV